MLHGHNDNAKTLAGNVCHVHHLNLACWHAKIYIIRYLDGVSVKVRGSPKLL